MLMMSNSPAIAGAPHMSVAAMDNDARPAPARCASVGCSCFAAAITAIITSRRAPSRNPRTQLLPVFFYSP